MSCDGKPERLYMYRRYSTRNLDNLRKRVIWFSHPSAFNDPFDCRAQIRHDEHTLTDDGWREIAANFLPRFAEKMSLNLAAAKQKFLLSGGVPNQGFRDAILLYAGNISAFFHQELSTMGVACFSTTNTDILMWAHYSDGHKGFCLEYDTSHPLFSKVLPVRYEKELPSLRMSQLTCRDANADLMSILTTKYECWQYEKEWRAFVRKANEPQAYSPSHLTGIYFGSEMPQVHQEILALILRDSPTRLYRMKKDEKRFAVHPEDAAGSA